MTFREWELHIFDAIDGIRQGFKSGMMSFYTKNIQARIKEDKRVDMSYKAIYKTIKKINVERGTTEVPVFDQKKSGGKTKYIGYVADWDEFYSVCKSPHAQNYLTMRLFEP